MPAIEGLTAEEKYLLCILQDYSGIDLAEFVWFDQETREAWRAWPFQWKWFRDQHRLQIDQCVAEGTLILTRRGQVPIEQVEVGDEVLTHEGRWKPVTYVWDRGEQDVAVLKGHGHPGLRVTPDHRFFTADGGWEAPVAGALWGSPSEFPAATVPVLPERGYAPGRPSNVPHDAEAAEFLWLYGLYLAEGSCSSSFGRGGTLNRTTFSVHTAEVAKVEAALSAVGIRFNTQQVAQEACFNIVVNSRPLAEWFSTQGGKGARHKEIAPWVLGLSDTQRRAVLDGAMFGDGYTARNQYTTVSLKLAVSIKLLAQSLRNSVTFRRVAGRTSSIAGRLVVGGEQFVVGFSRDGKAAKIGYDSHWWSRVKSKEPIGSVRVYDLEVEDDHSFVAESIVVSNCARSIGKTLSITLRMFAFPFLFPGQEAVVTAPELVHLEPLTNLIERKFYETRLGREMLPKGRSAVTHRPFMCVAGGQLVLTVNGYVPIEKVQVGDMVLTHQGRWRPVIATWDNGEQDVVSIKGQGHTGLVVTPEHQLWSCQRKQKEDRTGKRRMIRVAQPPEWRKVADWRTSDPATMWASPAAFDCPAPPADFRLNNRGFGVGNGALISVQSEAFMWFLGHYLAEGSVTGANLICLSIHGDEAERVGAHLTALHIRHDIVETVGSLGVTVRMTNAALADWLRSELPGHASEKQVPLWVCGLSRPLRQAFFDGYVYGDGTLTVLGHQHPWSASKGLVYSLRLLCNTLGYSFGVSPVPGKTSIIRGHTIISGPQTQMHVNMDEKVVHQHTFYMGGMAWTAATKIHSAGRRRVHDLSVAEDESYVVEGVVVHNCNFRNGSRIIGRIPQRDGKGVKGIHPIWLELDEAQDYPEPGWTELNETLKTGHEGSMWRAHGVTRGIRDKFYQYTQDSPTNRWKVHRFTAQCRPNWSDEERADKIQQYQSRDNPDYRRNVLGLHGDATNPLFVLHRLMQAVDDDMSSDYNTAEYQNYRINYERLIDRGSNHEATEFLEFPERHRSYRNVWVGMDVGLTNHPSEILIFVEIPGKEITKLKLITRIHLERVSSPQQARVIGHVMAFYNPRAFSMDKTGLGLPLFQELQEFAPEVAARIKGYGFSEKILVDFDEEAIKEMQEGDDDVKEAGITKNVLEYATDKLRELVDHDGLLLPWDTDLISEFQGQTWSYSKEAMDMYGRRRRVYSQGSFHALDAARMAVLGYAQFKIEEMMRLRKAVDSTPVLDIFMD